MPAYSVSVRMYSSVLVLVGCGFLRSLVLLLGSTQIEQEIGSHLGVFQCLSVCLSICKTRVVLAISSLIILPASSSTMASMSTMSNFCWLMLSEAQLSSMPST